MASLSVMKVLLSKSTIFSPLGITTEGKEGRSKGCSYAIAVYQNPRPLVCPQLKFSCYPKRWHLRSSEPLRIVRKTARHSRPLPEVASMAFSLGGSHKLSRQLGVE